MNSIVGKEKSNFLQKKWRNALAATFCSITMKLLPFTRLIAAAAFALGLSSCLEIHETVTLKKDGSGTIVEETVLGAQLSAMMQMAALQGGGGEAPDLFGEEAAKKRAEKFGKGVTVAKIDKIDQQGKSGSRVTYQFTDINTVSLDMSDGASSLNAMSPQGAEEKPAPLKPITFRYKDGLLTIVNPKPKKEELDAAKETAKDATQKTEIPAVEDAVEEGAEAAQMQAMAMQMMKDMKMSAKVVIEPGIAETNATHHSGDTITLIQMEMSKLLASPEVMKEFQSLDIKNPDALEKKLQSIEGVKGEEKESVSVKLK